MYQQTSQTTKQKNSQVSMAFQDAQNRAEKMRKEHGDTSFAIRDVLLGMIEKSADKRTVTIAPGIANRILNEANFPWQRAITDERLYAVKRYIAQNVWNPNHVIHFVLLEDGAMWLVNGQTRMRAIAEAGLPQKVGIIVQRVKDENAARMVYTEFDLTSGGRTTNQMLNASGISDETGLPKAYAVQVFSAVGIIAGGLCVGRGSARNEKDIVAKNIHNRMEGIIEWADEAHRYYSAIEGAGKDIRRQLRRAGTMAVALITYRHQPKKAAEFWPRVADGVNLTKNDPRLVLARDLPIRNTSVGIADVSIQQSALAWNAFYENRELKILKCTSEWHLKVSGTPIGKDTK